jgi:hypothetical protein
MYMDQCQKSPLVGFDRWCMQASSCSLTLKFGLCLSVLLTSSAVLIPACPSPTDTVFHMDRSICRLLLAFRSEAATSHLRPSPVWEWS